MEFWEGAIIVVGGIFLIGRMSRRSPNHPINSIPLQLSGGTGKGLNPTTATNRDGSDSLIAGEPFNPGQTSIGVSSGAPSCCGGGGGLPSIVNSSPVSGQRITVGASTGTPRSTVMVPRTGPIPIRQLPSTIAPVPRTGLSPAAQAPRQTVRFYAV